MKVKAPFRFVRRNLKAGDGYSVQQDPRLEIAALCCDVCGAKETRMQHRRGGDKSGLARYGRMRHAMLAHIKVFHPEQQFEVVSAEQPGCERWRQ